MVTDRFLSLSEEPTYEPGSTLGFDGGYPLCMVYAQGVYFILRANNTTTLSIFRSDNGFDWSLTAAYSKTLTSSGTSVTSAAYMNGYIYFCCNGILYKIVVSSGVIGAMTTVSSSGYYKLILNPSNTVLWVMGTSAISYAGAYITASSGSLVSSSLTFKTVTWKDDSVIIGVYGYEYDGSGAYGNTTVYEYTYSGTLLKATSLSGKTILNNSGHTLSLLGPVMYSNGIYALLCYDSNSTVVTAYSFDDLGSLYLSNTPTMSFGEFDFFNYGKYNILCRGHGETYVSTDFMATFTLVNDTTTTSLPGIGYMAQMHPIVNVKDHETELMCSYVTSSNVWGIS